MKYLVQHFIEDTFKTSANDIAIQQGKRNFRYKEIDELSSLFGEYFRGIKNSNKLIGILSRVRAEAIVAMIGALKADIPYVPLNTLAPVSWLGNIIRTAGIQVLLVDPQYMQAAQELRAYGIKTVIGLDEEYIPDSNDAIAFQAIDKVTIKAPRSDKTALAEDIAYILYTSGSTGTPKGILITHRNAYTFIDWMHREFDLNPSDRIFNRAPLQFDLSVFDIYSTFAAGARLILPPMGFSNSPQDVVSLMIEEGVTMVYTVPSTFISWLTKGNLDRNIPTMRQVMYAGEPFPVPYLRKVMECLPQARFSNIYGPTETNIVTYFHLDGGIPSDQSSVPIGRPVHDTEAFIVDEDMRPVSGSEIGEILIRGGTVFAGYFNDHERTREKLILSPFHSYPTMCCRTGDLGRWLPDGNIEYHGRMDNMVKTRGYRVELAEVENALSSIEGINELAVIPKPHEKYGNTLHAFVACAKGVLSADRLRQEMETRVPSYMVPYEFIFMEVLPKTSTGKVDRVTLGEVLHARTE